MMSDFVIIESEMVTLECIHIEALISPIKLLTLHSVLNNMALPFIWCNESVTEIVLLKECCQLKHMIHFFVVLSNLLLRR